MDVRNFQIFAGSAIAFSDVFYRLIKLKNMPLKFTDKLFYSKYNWFSRGGYFALPGWIWGSLIALLILIEHKL
jgi:hypothetical protein